MKIQNQNQNFGALRIRPKAPNGYLELTGKGKAYATKAINQELQNYDKFVSMLEIASKFNAKTELGLNDGRDCLNIMTKKDSKAEKQALQELKELFATDKKGFEIESTTMAEAKVSAKNFINTYCK